MIVTFLIFGMTFGLGHGASFHNARCHICHLSNGHRRELPVGFGVRILEKAVKSNESWVGKLNRAEFYEAHSRFVRQAARDKLVRLEAEYRFNTLSYEKLKRQQMQLKADEEKGKARKETYKRIQAMRTTGKPDGWQDTGRKENERGFKSCYNRSDWARVMTTK